MDKHIKRILEMSSYDPKKGKKYITESLDEQPLGQQAAPAPGQQPQPNAANTEATLDKLIDSSLAEIMKDLPQQLQQLATTQGDKDGQLELVGQQGQQPQQQAAPAPGQQTAGQNPQAEAELNEAILATLAGGALAAPALADLFGKTTAFLGKKLDNQTIQEFGKKLSHSAEHLHHKYIGGIEAVIGKINPKMDPQTKHTIANRIFYTLVAGLGGAGAFGATHAIQGGNLGLAAIESALTGVKASELISLIKPILFPKIVSTVVA